MGIEVPTCSANDKDRYNCPSKAKIDHWQQNGLLSKVHMFWGHHDLPLPKDGMDVLPNMN